MIRRLIEFNRKWSQRFESLFPETCGGRNYTNDLNARIAGSLANRRYPTILEVGGIDRPLLTRCEGYLYVGLDIDERALCHRVYDSFVVQSVEDRIDLTADLVISCTLLEHVPNNEAAVRSIFACLKQDGQTHHYVPSKWHPYSVILRMIGPALQKKLIRVLRPGAVDLSGYPTYFDFCVPSTMKRLFESVGFEDVDIDCYFRANDYFAFFFPAFVCVTLFENLCRRFRMNFFASGFIISARKKMISP
jgi:hypothetical protein